MGLVGLVIFSSVMEIGISGISGISLFFGLNLFHDDAPAREQCRDILWHGTRRFWGHGPREMESTYLGLVLHGHTYLSRVHTALQCMTMCEETALGTLPARNRIHLPWSRVVWACISGVHSCHSAMHDRVEGDCWRKTIRNINSRILTCDTSSEWRPIALTFNVDMARRHRTRGYANNVNSAKPPVAHARQHWTSGQGGCHSVARAKRDASPNVIYSNSNPLPTYFHQPSKKHCVLVFQGLARKCVVRLFWVCAHSTFIQNTDQSH